ncbi:MAG: hypothetical protein JSV65_15850 [Armatimonadota bacterium]|nr:MAG: hypothetical protein JSV65_15850 [Armatimonadota bacterium]
MQRTDDGGVTWAPEKGEGEVPPLREITWLAVIDFADSRTGWIIGLAQARDEANGTAGDTLNVIWRTTDAGDTWEREIGEGRELRDLSVISEREAWAIAQYRRTPQPNALLHTVDGGITWRKVSHPLSQWPDVELCGIHFADEFHGWVMVTTWGRTANAAVLKTEDGGMTFEMVRTEAVSGGGGTCRLEFPTQNEGWAIVDGVSLLHTVDGGKAWELVTPNVGGVENEAYLMDLSFPTRLEGWVVGQGGVALHTRDGGKTWQRVETGAEGIESVWLTEVVFVDERHGWMAGQGGRAGAPGGPGPFDLIISPTHLIGFILKYEP